MTQRRKKTTTHSDFVLSDANYYTPEADQAYMSVSQYKSFLQCEAAALAKLKGDWQPASDPTALLVGNYVHSYFESAEIHKKFKEENREKMFSSRKPHGLLKDFKMAEQMIQRLEQEEAFLNLYQGEKEVIVTGEIGGVMWKGKIDCLNLADGYFVDIKTTKDIHERKWNDHYKRKVTFIENYGYVLQMAVYSELLRQQHDIGVLPIIAAVSKQTPSGAKLIVLDEQKMVDEMDALTTNIDRVAKVKNGEEDPVACGVCEYCRGHNRITNFINMEDL